MVGHCSLAYVAKALQDYLRGFITREAGATNSEIDSVLLNAKINGGSWLKRYARFLSKRTGFRWDDSPVKENRIREVITARDIITHDLSIDGAWPMRTETKEHQYIQTFNRSGRKAKGGAKPTFGDELYIATHETDVPLAMDSEGNPEPLKVTVPVHVTREKLLGAIADVRCFCKFVESCRTKW